MSSRLSWRFVAAIFTIVFVTPACGGGSDSGPVPPVRATGKAVSATGSISVVPKSQPAPVEKVRITLQDATLAPQQRLIFTAVALDEANVPVPRATVKWRVLDKVAGRINEAGVFTAGGLPGVYTDAVEAYVTKPGGEVTAQSSVVIGEASGQTTGLLDTLVVYPPSIMVAPGSTVGLGAVGWDKNGRFVRNIKMEWSTIDPDAGSTDQFGFFTASAKTGIYPMAIRVIGTDNTLAGGIQKETFVSVEVTERVQGGFLSKVVVVPGSVNLLPMQRVGLIARAFDEGGQRLKDVSFSWAVDARAGELVGPGQLIAAEESGHYGQAVRVTAQQRVEGRTVTAEATVEVIVREHDAVKHLASAQLTPRLVTLRPGQRFVFQAFGVTDNGEPLGVDAQWLVVDPTAGSVDDNGFFIAGTLPGTYPEALEVQLVQADGPSSARRTAKASIHIVSSLASVQITPPVLEVEATQILSLHAEAFDEQGFRIDLVRFRWRLLDTRAGSLDEFGVFTASSLPGYYGDAVEVTAIELAPE